MGKCNSVSNTKHFAIRFDRFWKSKQEHFANFDENDLNFCEMLLLGLLQIMIGLFLFTTRFNLKGLLELLSTFSRQSHLVESKESLKADKLSKQDC